jgi:hypothetical protein
VFTVRAKLRYHLGKDLGFDSGFARSKALGFAQVFAQGFASGEARIKARMMVASRPRHGVKAAMILRHNSNKFLQKIESFARVSAETRAKPSISKCTWTPSEKKHQKKTYSLNMKSSLQVKDIPQVYL